MLTTKATKSKDIDQIIREARMMNLKINSPDINFSEEGFSINDEGILYGLSAVKNVGHSAIEEIMSNRPFKDSEDMSERCATQKVNKRVIKNLIASGAFDFCGERDKYSETEKMLLEKEVLGFSLTGKGAASEYANILDERITSSYDFENLPTGETLVIGGEISAIKEITTRNGEPMAFLEVVYGENVWNITVFANKYWSYKEFLHENSLVILRGKKDDYNEENIILSELASLPALAKQLK